jgi:hypothetical protein
MARQCTCFHSYYPALHYLGPPVGTKDCDRDPRRRNHHPGQFFFFELSLTRSDLPGPECQSRKTGRDSAPSRSTVACEPTQYRCGLPQSTVAASKAQKKNSMHDDNSTRDLGNVEVCYHIVLPAAHTVDYVKRKTTRFIEISKEAGILLLLDLNVCMLVPKFFKSKLFNQALPLNLTIWPHR